MQSKLAALKRQVGIGNDKQTLLHDERIAEVFRSLTNIWYVICSLVFVCAYVLEFINKVIIS